MVVVSSDDEDDKDPSTALDPSDDDDEDDVKARKRSTVKSKPTQKTSRLPPAASSSSSKNQSSQISPKKAKPSKVKSKTAVKDSPKAKGKPIYSFFNTATQKQQSTQPTPSPQKSTIPEDDPEAIQDDSEDGHGGSVHLAKGSSTALALRKRKVQHGGSFDNDVGLSLPASQKFRKTSSGERVPSLAIINDDKRPWNEQFAPRDLSELVVHKKKVSDVRQWLEMALSGRRQRILVLKGSAGTGKTTTVQLLAQDMKLQLTQWRNPAGMDTSTDSSASTASQFAEFVGRAGRGGGLQLASNPDDDQVTVYEDDSIHAPLENDEKHLLLIEEFPNTFSRASSTLQSFRSTLMQYLSSPNLPDGSSPTPIVMVISETLLSTNTALADSFTTHRLLGPELANHPYLDMIEFNAVAPTYLTKALEAIVLKEARKSGRRRTPGPQVLKHLAESGDIRSAVSSLEFLCLRGDEGDTWSSKVALGKQKKSKIETPLTQSEVEALRLISNRETTLGIFHAVGKVVYNKRIDSPSITHPPPWLPQHRRNKIPENDVDEMIDELGTDASTFIAALHENYALSCGSGGDEESLDSLLGCMESLSEADLLSPDRFASSNRVYSGTATDSLRQDEMAFQVAVRGILFSLPNPVHRSAAANTSKADAHKLFYPASLKLWKQREEIQGVLELLTAKFQTSGLSGSPEVASDKGKGIESWKRNDSSTNPDLNDRETVSTVISSMKTEMLIERLPYMAQTLTSRRDSQAIGKQIATVTQIRGATLLSTDDDAEVDESEGMPAEQWATDRPDAEVGLRSLSKKKESNQVFETSRSGLSIPVESSIERLVLDDDDIVDDL